MRTRQGEPFATFTIGRLLKDAFLLTIVVVASHARFVHSIGVVVPLFSFYNQKRHYHSTKLVAQHIQF